MTEYSKKPIVDITCWYSWLNHKKVVMASEYLEGWSGVNQTCKKCVRQDLLHGVIELPEHDEVLWVCPSDFIITYANDDVEVVSEKHFRRYYMSEVVK